MITGNFKGFIVFTSIILIHELGHILAGYYFKWNIEKVILLPFGALTIFNEKINKPLYQEFIILITGPIFQIIFTLLMSNEYITYYSSIILLFNLLPIYPLDGSKLLNIILNKITNFKRSHLITIYISILFIIIILKIKLNLFVILIMIFLILKVIDEIKIHNYLFNKFLFERYIYNFNFKKTKIIHNYKDMKRDYKHIFKGKRYYTETEKLREKFDTNIKI